MKEPRSFPGSLKGGLAVQAAPFAGPSGKVPRSLALRTPPPLQPCRKPPQHPPSPSSAPLTSQSVAGSDDITSATSYCPVLSALSLGTVPLTSEGVVRIK